MRSNGLGAVAPTVSQSVSQSFQVVARWVEALHGHGELQNALKALADLTGARIAHVGRVAETSGMVKTVAVADADAGRMFSNRRHRLFGPSLLADLGMSPRDGSVWTLSDILASGDAHLSRDLGDDIRRAGISDILFVPLGTARGSRDYMEFHFASGIAPQIAALLEALGPCLADAWTSRLPGTVESLTMQGRLRQVSEDCEVETQDILCVSNPASLSRSEYRICALIREGMLTEEVSETLNIRKSTMRSHLRSIYAKTGVSSQAELIHALTRPATRSAALARAV